MIRSTLVSNSQLRGTLPAVIACMAWPGISAADIITTGVVTPPEVTTGVVNESVILGDINTLEPGTLTIDNGSSLVVNAPERFGGVSVNVPGNLLVVSSGTLTSTGFIALNVDRDSNVVIDSGSQVTLVGEQNGVTLTALLVGSRGGADLVSSVNVDGTDTLLSLTGAVGISSLTGTETAQLNLSNGATVVHDGTSSTGRFGGFVVGGNGAVGELSLVSGSTLQSSVPQTLIGREFNDLTGFGTVQLAGSSLYEASTAMTVGLDGGVGTVSLDDSTMRVLADVGAPAPDAGSIFLAIGDSTSVGNILMDNGAIAEIDDSVYVSHDGTSGSGLGTALVSVCNSTLTANDVVIGENGTLSGTTINANVIVDGGTVNPGCSPGDMTIAGDFVVNSGELVIEVDSQTAADTITVVGNADLSSPDAKVTLSFSNGYAPQAGEMIDFIAAETISLPPDPAALIEVTGLANDVDFSVVPTEAGFDVMAESDGVPEAVSPSLSIRPFGPNRISTRFNFLIPVAVLTTQDAPIFDATKIDPSTVAFGPAGAAPKRFFTRKVDVDFDGDRDLLLWFRVQETGIACGDTSAGLTASTVAGTSVSASDEVIVLNCN